MCYTGKRYKHEGSEGGEQASKRCAIQEERKTQGSKRGTKASEILRCARQEEIKTQGSERGTKGSEVCKTGRDKNTRE